MKQQILQALKASQIRTYLINKVEVESVELFFIKQELDMSRKKKVAHYVVTVYQDFEAEGSKMRGSATANIYPTMTYEEVETTLKDAYYAASFVKNPYYPLPVGTKEEKVSMSTSIEGDTLEARAAQLTKALFKYDQEAEVFVNSSELFVEKRNVSIINSEGIEVAYEKYCTKGEFVIQCTVPQDVETYHDFYYENLECEALSQKVKKALETTTLRAQAKQSPKTGKYKVILSGEHIATLLSYYTTNAAASMIYPNYSNYKIGDCVQGQNIQEDVLNITLKATEPWSGEGIKMIDRPLLQKGVLKTIHGASKFSHYLGIEPTGGYNTIEVETGSHTLEAMKQGAYLEVISFSDFQVDPFTGDFGGEMRLALYHDGTQIIPLTGGSISGVMQELQGHLILSVECQVRRGYTGPLAVCLEGIMVAGE
ncbi:MAG: metallopeptidase TldD-related protein [Niameybacter sp.]